MHLDGTRVELPFELLIWPAVGDELVDAQGKLCGVSEVCQHGHVDILDEAMMYFGQAIFFDCQEHFARCFV